MIDQGLYVSIKILKLVFRISDHYGPIRSCDDMMCRYGAVCSIHDSVAMCDCHMSCQRESTFVTVCGTDGQTYASHCELNLFSCRLQREIQVGESRKWGGACICRGKAEIMRKFFNL